MNDKNVFDEILKHFSTTFNPDIYNRNYETIELIREMKEVEKLIKPPIGLKPKDVYWDEANKERFVEVCGAISRYYNSMLEIPIIWIEEYNDLVKLIKKE